MVGKTSILQRYIEDNYVENNGTVPTLAWDFKVKELDIHPQRATVGDDF